MKPKTPTLLRFLCAVLIVVLAGCALPMPSGTNPPAPTATAVPALASTATLPPTPTQTSTATSTPPGKATPTLAGNLTPAPSQAATTAGLAKSLVVGYYSSASSARGYKVANIPVDQLDVLIYGFLGLTPSGECFSVKSIEDADNFIALKLLKLDHRQLKTMVSVGGAAYATLFSNIAANPALRTHFAQACGQFIKKNGFDGIDIDWEYPVGGGQAGVRNPADKQNFTALLAALRAQLDSQGAADGTRYLLSAALPAGSGDIANLELGPLAASLDWLDLLAYKFAGETSATTNLTSPLRASPTDPSPQRQTENIDAAVKAYLTAGVPANKLVLGVAFNGRGWQGVPGANNGLYQANGGPAQGTWAKDGVFGYQDLVSSYLPGYTRSFQNEAQAPWLYNPKTQIFISYEDPQSLGAKADYASANHLGGIMVWELSFDDAQHSLLSTIYKKIHP